MTKAPGDGPLDLGNLSVYIGDGSTGVVGQPFQLDDILYSMSGGMVDLRLTKAQAAAAVGALFFVVSSLSSLVGLRTFKGLPVLWSESSTGTWIACNDRAFQLASDTPSQGSGNAAIYVTQWGAPVSYNDAIRVGVYPCFPGNSQATVPWSGGYKGNTQSSMCCLETALTYLAPGHFQLNLTAVKDPGSRTPELDSQLYFVAVWPSSQPEPPANLNPTSPPQEQLVACVVWASYPLNTNPDFSEIRRIFNVYNKLFPAMKAKMDLTDQQTVFTFSMNPPWAFFQRQGLPGPASYPLSSTVSISKGSIPYYLTRDINDPRFMPIMRNLSPNKLLTVLWYAYNLQHRPSVPPARKSIRKQGGRKI